MTRAEAVDLMYRRDPLFRNKIRLLKGWDPSKSLSSNATTMGMLYTTVKKLVVLLNLPCVKGCRGRPIKESNKIKNALIRKLYKEGHTYEDVGRMFGLSKQRAEQIVKYRGVKYGRTVKS